VNQVPASLWQSDPMTAAEEAICLAEKPFGYNPDPSQCRAYSRQRAQDVARAYQLARQDMGAGNGPAGGNGNQTGSGNGSGGNSGSSSGSGNGHGLGLPIGLPHPDIPNPIGGITDAIGKLTDPTFLALMGVGLLMLFAGFNALVPPSILAAA
jgi:hypothetical protein